MSQDSYGNSFAQFHEGASHHVMLAGHIDEIGLIITYIDDEGFLYIKTVGGWDSQQLVGQRVRVVGFKGQELLGVIGKKPIHLMKASDRDKVSLVEDMWIDIGAKNKTEALQYVRVGDFAVIEQPLIELLNGRLVSKAIDNRIGAYIVLEAAKRAASQSDKVAISAVATVQEEIGGIGAYVASYRLKPDVAIAVDVTHATDVPGINKKQDGEVPLASGACLSIGSYVHRGTLDKLIEVAKAGGVGYTLEPAPRNTYTDADDIAKNRHGVPSAVVSIPNRYMHSPNEMIDIADVEALISLIEAFILNLATP
ncbi:MAG: M20/M25/M40 family metallo-hydrolase [Deinococcales bacterium]